MTQNLHAVFQISDLKSSSKLYFEVKGNLKNFLWYFVLF
jgi:hypothetical protein